MIRGFMVQAIIKLWTDGKSKKAIAKAVGHDIKTIRKIIKLYQTTGASSLTYKPRETILDPFKNKIQELLEHKLTNIRIFEEIKKLGYSGKYSSITRYTRTLKHDPKICVRFHTKPGEEAQIDFGEVARCPSPDGTIRKAYIFNMRLSYSRYDYYEIVFDQKVETFIKCHINAFKYFGGTPATLKIDNLKSAIINASFYEPLYQDNYKNMTAHYNCTILPCRVRKPQEKGKVEAGIKYIKNNFFAGRKFKDNASMNLDLQYWLDNYCNVRIHGTTKERPKDLFLAQEKASLMALPTEHFTLGSRFLRKVHSDCHITIDNNYYSLPYKYVSQRVEVELSDSLVKIYHNNEMVAMHTRVKGKGQFSTMSAHYPRYKNFSHDSELYLNQSKEEMSTIGEYTKLLFTKLVKENKYSWYRTVRGILSLRKKYSDKVINLACKRALYFEITQYSKIKSICESGSYNMELPI